MDKRKWKKGGQAKVEKANQNLDNFRRDCEKYPIDPIDPIVTQVVDKMKKVKVKKVVKGPEVD